MGEPKLESMSVSPHLHPAPPLEPVVIKEPAFLRENWKKILGSTNEYRPELRFVRVANRVATVTNGTLIVRYPANHPDGFYVLNERNDLVESDFTHWMRYPDIEAMKPLFTSMVHTPSAENPHCIRTEHIGRFLEFVGFVRDRDRLGLKRGCVVLEKTGAYSRYDQGLEFKQFPCQLPIVGDFLAFDAGNLHMALVELLRYDHVIIAYENRLTRRAPLFMGQSWEKCVLIMPTEF